MTPFVLFQLNLTFQGITGEWNSFESLPINGLTRHLTYPVSSIENTLNALFDFVQGLLLGRKLTERKIPLKILCPRVGQVLPVGRNVTGIIR